MYMKKLKSLTIMSAFVVTMAVSLSSCGTYLNAVMTKLDDLNQRIAAVEQELNAVQNENARLKDLIADDNKEIERLKYRQ